MISKYYEPNQELTWYLECESEEMIFWNTGGDKEKKTDQQTDKEDI